jgi:transposase
MIKNHWAWTFQNDKTTFIAIHPNSTWAERMSLLIVNALALKKTDYITKASVDEVLRSFTDLINEQVSSIFKEVIPFQKRLVKYSDFVFNFLQYEDVPPDNNGAERAIRNFKTKLKISGLFRSDKGAERFAVIRSIIDTTIKNNRNPLHITRLIAQCNVATEWLQLIN